MVPKSKQNAKDVHIALLSGRAHVHLLIWVWEPGTSMVPEL